MYVCQFLTLVECINFAEIEIKKFGLKAPMVGHVGDGNFHAIIMYDLAVEGSYQKDKRF